MPRSRHYPAMSSAEFLLNGGFNAGAGKVFFYFQVPIDIGSDDHANDDGHANDEDGGNDEAGGSDDDPMDVDQMVVVGFLHDIYWFGERYPLFSPTA